MKEGELLEHELMMMAATMNGGELFGFDVGHCHSHMAKFTLFIQSEEFPISHAEKVFKDVKFIPKCSVQATLRCSTDHTVKAKRGRISL